MMLWLLRLLLSDGTGDEVRRGGMMNEPFVMLHVAC